jgi:hypothetical protein
MTLIEELKDILRNRRDMYLGTVNLDGSVLDRGIKELEGAKKEAAAIRGEIACDRCEYKLPDRKCALPTK